MKYPDTRFRIIELKTRARNFVVVLLLRDIASKTVKHVRNPDKCKWHVLDSRPVQEG